MELFNSLLIGIPVFIILLGPLMFVHELGHFIAAKRAGVRVEEFGLGFPPRLATLFRRGDTTYSLNWLPIGAFVRMTGEEDPSDPLSFAAQSKRWRFIILFMGPAMNFAFAVVVLFAAYLLFATEPTEVRYRIAKVDPGSAAEAIGFQPGDMVMSVNGVDALERPVDGELQDPSILKRQAQASIGGTFRAVVQRPLPESGAGDYRTVELAGEIAATARYTAPLGVQLSTEILASRRVYYTAPQALARSVEDLSTAIVGLARAPFDLIAGRLAPEQARPVGVVGITSIGVSLLDDGVFPFLRFAGLLSMLIGLTNLLPLPALDGGRILFVLIEWVRGRRIDPRREQWVHGIGMIFLLALSAVIIAFDIIDPVQLP
jgi:regulator of sigma E protease